MRRVPPQNRKKSTAPASPRQHRRPLQRNFGVFWEDDNDEDGYMDNPDWLVGAD